MKRKPPESAVDFLSLPQHLHMARAEWVVDTEVFSRAVRLIDTLPARYQDLIEELVRSPKVLHGFMTAPASCRDHHAQPGGLLLHSVEVAEGVEALCLKHPVVQRDMAVFIGLTHDFGKALEYVEDDDGYSMSLEGDVLGHRCTTLMLMTLALNELRRLFSRVERLRLLHAYACGNAPDYVGLRAPQTPEARLVNSVDKASGDVELMARLTAGRSNGVGRFHPHLKGRPMVAPDRVALP